MGSVLRGLKGPGSLKASQNEKMGEEEEDTGRACDVIHG